VRKELREAGEPTLTLGELGSLIKKTEAEAEAAEGLGRDVILLRLSDMHREFHWRTFLGENTTDWPAGQPANPNV
jgi:hypothetical protein